jgi:hypothetical protein
VRGRNGELAAGLFRELRAGAAQVLRVEQQTFDDGQHRAARRRQACEALAGAHEELDAQFVFEFADLAAHAGLRRGEFVGNFGEIEAAPHRLAHGAKRLEVHRIIGTTARRAPSAAQRAGTGHQSCTHGSPA